MFKIPEQKTAILVFAQSAEEEIRYKPIAKSLGLFQLLNVQMVAEVKKSGLPYFHISEELQKGQTFGERFTNAIELVFQNGFDHVITIGNDSPQLKSKHLLSAANALNHGKSIIGPSLDGGFYLLGIHKKHFDKNTFIDFSWRQKSLSKEIRSYLRNLNVETERLGYLLDIDSIKDIKQLLSGKFLSLSRRIRKLFTAILTNAHKVFELSCQPLRLNTCRLCDSVRGSP